MLTVLAVATLLGSEGAVPAGILSATVASAGKLCVTVASAGKLCATAMLGFGVTALTVLPVALWLMSNGVGFTCCELCTFDFSGFGSIVQLGKAPDKQVHKDEP